MMRFGLPNRGMEVLLRLPPLYLMDQIMLYEMGLALVDKGSSSADPSGYRIVVRNASSMYTGRAFPPSR
jgi:hypothetical protein